MHILLIEPNPIALLDLVCLLRKKWPEAVIETASTTTQSKHAVQRMEQISVAIVGMPLVHFTTADLPTEIEDKNGKIILSHDGRTGIDHDIRSRGWVPLMTPFTNDGLQEAFVRAELA